MSYIGNTQQNQNYFPAVDFFSGNDSTTAFTLTRPVATTAAIQVIVANVAQNPSSAYTVNGNTITFTSAPPSGTNNIYVYYTSPNNTVIQPSDGTVQTSSIATGAVTADKIAANAITTSKLPVGTVLQVVQTVKTDTFTSSATSFVDVTGLSVSITPTSATNKILVILDLGLGVTAGGSACARLVRNSTSIYVGDSAGSRPLGLTEVIDQYTLNRVTAFYLDSPTTTSTTTYKAQVQTTGTNACVNRTGADRDTTTYDARSASSITVMEIAA